MICQPDERFHHVSIAQVPRGNFAPKHVAVIFFGVSHHQRVLFRAKISVGCHLAVALQVFHRFVPKLDEVFYDGLLRRSASCENQRRIRKL